MAETVKTLKSSGGDYTAATVQSGWIATYLTGKSGSFTGDEVLEVDNAEFAFTAGLDFTGINPGGNKIIIRPAAGASLAAQRPAASNAMRYGAGARMRFTGYGYDMITFGANNVELQDMAFQRTLCADSVPFRGISGKTGCAIRRCLFEGDDPSSAPIFSSPLTVQDVMAILDTDGVPRIWWKDANGPSAGNSDIRGCTFIGDAKFQTVGGDSLTAYNNVHLGMTGAPYDAAFGSITADYCATDYSSMGSGGGTHHDVSVTPTAEVTNVTFAASAYDFRSKSTGAIADTGSAAQKTTTDFYGTTRDTTPYKGAHEATVDGGGGGGAKPPRRQMNGGMRSLNGGF